MPLVPDDRLLSGYLKSWVEVKGSSPSGGTQISRSQVRILLGSQVVWLNALNWASLDYNLRRPELGLLLLMTKKNFKKIHFRLDKCDRMSYLCGLTSLNLYNETAS